MKEFGDMVTQAMYYRQLQVSGFNWATGTPLRLKQ